MIKYILLVSILILCSIITGCTVAKHIKPAVNVRLSEIIEIVKTAENPETEIPFALETQDGDILYIIDDLNHHKSEDKKKITNHLCPNCGSSNTTCQRYEQDGTVYDQCHCHKCRHNWEIFVKSKDGNKKKI